jgi:hypothetical protein
LQQGYYSGKAKQHTIKYEIGVHPDTGFLVWVGGPVAGAVHDMTLARKSGVLDLLGENEFILADKGYVGHFCIITPFKGELTEAEKAINHFLGSRRWIVEHIIKRIKNFNCLRQKWRHSRTLHKYVFYVITEIVNIDLHFRPVRK